MVLALTLALAFAALLAAALFAAALDGGLVEGPATGLRARAAAAFVVLGGAGVVGP